VGKKTGREKTLSFKEWNERRSSQGGNEHRSAGWKKTRGTRKKPKSCDFDHPKKKQESSSQEADQKITRRPTGRQANSVYQIRKHQKDLQGRNP